MLKQPQSNSGTTLVVRQGLRRRFRRVTDKYPDGMKEQGETIMQVFEEVEGAYS